MPSFRAIAHVLTWFARARISHLDRRLEIAFVIFLVAGLFWIYRGLFFEDMTLKHDDVLWYGMFHYFTESLWAGEFPYWNPYVHGGEPFYYVWNIIRLTDPVTLLTIAAINTESQYQGYFHMQHC